MVFALDHADANVEIVATIKESLTLDSTPLATKMARLYLLSDILHNSQSGVKNASRYRSEVQKALPAVMVSFGASLKSSSGRMTAQALKEQVMKVMEVWDRWSLYPAGFIQELVASFLGTEFPAKKLEQLEDVDGEPMGDIDGTPMEEDIDGEDIDGEDIDGEDIDGEDINGEDIDGEDMDGEPVGGGGGGNGPDLRKLPLSELMKLCQQQGLPSHGTQEQLVARLTQGV